VKNPTQKKITEPNIQLNEISIDEIKKY
jgi:hypothetical protein